MNETCKVVFTGELHPETDLEQAQMAMVMNFGLSPEKAAALLQTKRPIVIKKGLQKEQGQKLGRRLSDIGLLVKLVREQNVKSEPSAPIPPKPPAPPEVSAAKFPPQTEADAADTPPVVNPYAAPEAKLETADAGELQRGEPQKLSAGQGYRWLVDAFGMFKAHPLAWVGAVVFTYFFVILLSLIPIVGMFVGTFLSPIFFGGMMLGAHQQAEGDRFLFKSVFGGFSNSRNQLLLLGLFSVAGLFACMLPFLVFFGVSFFSGQFEPETLDTGFAVSFLIGGLLSAVLTIPYYMFMWFAPTIVVVSRENAWSAMKLSFKAAKKNMLPFLVYSITLMGAVAVLGIGAAILIPSLAATGFESMAILFGFLALGAVVLILPAAVVVLISIYTGYRSIFYK